MYYTFYFYVRTHIIISIFIKQTLAVVYMYKDIHNARINIFLNILILRTFNPRAFFFQQLFSDLARTIFRLVIR